MPWSPAILHQQDCILHLDGPDESKFWGSCDDINAVVEPDGREGYWEPGCAGSNSTHKGWEAGVGLSREDSIDCESSGASELQDLMHYASETNLIPSPTVIF